MISATRRVDVVEDGDDRDPGAARRTVGAQLGKPPVVRLRARHQQLGVAVTALTESGTERCRRARGDGVGVGEDDLTRDAVGIELLVAPGRVPAAAEAFLVLALPLLGERLVAHAARPQLGFELRSCRLLRVEGGVVPGVEPVAVLRIGKTRVTVGRDHHVALHARVSLQHVHPAIDRT